MVTCLLQVRVLEVVRKGHAWFLRIFRNERFRSVLICCFAMYIFGVAASGSHPVPLYSSETVGIESHPVVMKVFMCFTPMILDSQGINESARAHNCLLKI